jgi:hydroxymethylpyrimidine/phosphomethylpyrimidine kinase
MNSHDETDGMARKSAVLTIAGSDSGGNAGIQADLRAFHTFGVHGCTAITALTAQNPFKVSGILTADGDFVTEQIDAVIEVYNIRALKTGMLCSADIIEAVASTLACHNRILKVIDPVMIATSGARLLEDDAIEVMKKQLLPLAALITPNLPEAETLLGRKLDCDHAIAEAARALFESYGCATLIKGGHNPGAAARDLLFDGESALWFGSPVVEDPRSTHGTGCSLSAAIAAAFATGKDLHEAITAGKAYVYESIRTGINVGECAAVLGTPRNIPIDSITISPYSKR